MQQIRLDFSQLSQCHMQNKILKQLPELRDSVSQYCLIAHSTDSSFQNQSCFHKCVCFKLFSGQWFLLLAFMLFMTAMFLSLPLSFPRITTDPSLSVAMCNQTVRCSSHYYFENMLTHLFLNYVLDHLTVSEIYFTEAITEYIILCNLKHPRKVNS